MTDQGKIIPERFEDSHVKTNIYFVVMLPCVKLLKHFYEHMKLQNSNKSQICLADYA